MANTFYGSSATVTTPTVRTLVYTVPALTLSVLHSLQVVNTTVVALVGAATTVDIEIERATTPGVFLFLGKDVPLNVGSIFHFSSKINLNAGDTIHITTPGTVDVHISSLHVT